MKKHLKFCLFRSLLLLGVVFLVGCSRSDALWTVVDKVCMANYQHKRGAFPCQQVYIPSGKSQGFSIIQNPRFPYHFILVPTAAMSGIESPQLLVDSRIDYFGYAWLMRYRLAVEHGKPIPETMLAMALNSAYGAARTSCIFI